MKINIACVGRIKEKYLKEGIGEYSKRLSRFCDVVISEVDDCQAPESLSVALENQVKAKEGERLIKVIKPSAVVALDIKGARMTSEEFASKLGGFFMSSSTVTFVIGGSLGLDKSVLQMANLRLSFSDMTLPHQLMRLVLLEQVYRGFKIMNGETYHK